MKSRFVMAVTFAATMCLTLAPAKAQQVTKDTVPGITNLSRLETTVACSGAITPDAVPAIKKMGFVTIINLRESSEPGANVEAEEAAAKQVGMRYYHIPFNANMPDTAAADKFIEAITTKGYRAGLHSLLGRQPRGHHVAHQALGRGPLGRRSRHQGSQRSRPGQPETPAMGHRLCPSAQALTNSRRITVAPLRSSTWCGSDGFCSAALGWHLFLVI